MGAEENGEGSGEFFDEGEDVFAVLELVVHVVHALFDEEDAEPAYFAVLCGEGGVRIVLFQGIVGHAGVDEGEGGGERFTVEGSSQPQRYTPSKVPFATALAFCQHSKVSPFSALHLWHNV